MKVFKTEHDKVKGFKFDFYGYGLAEQKSGFNLSEMIQKITDNGKDTRICLLAYFYGGAISYAEANGQSDKIIMSDISDCFEAIGLDEAVRIFNQSLETYISEIKNRKAPEQSGHTQLKTA